MKIQHVRIAEKNKSPLILVLLIVLVAAIPGCYIDKEELLYPGSTAPVDCASTPAKFTADVLPIIQSKCAVSGCHDASASGGYIFQTYAQINAAKDRIQARAVVEKTMPSSGALPATDIAKIKCWIDGGALNN